MLQQKLCAQYSNLDQSLLYLLFCFGSKSAESILALQLSLPLRWCGFPCTAPCCTDIFHQGCNCNEAGEKADLKYIVLWNILCLSLLFFMHHFLSTPSLTLLLVELTTASLKVISLVIFYRCLEHPIVAVDLVIGFLKKKVFLNQSNRRKVNNRSILLSALLVQSICFIVWVLSYPLTKKKF